MANQQSNNALTSTREHHSRPRYRHFQFFKMAAAAILDFKNFKFLTVRTVKKVELHQCVKFHRNRSNHGRDMVFLDFSRWRRRHLGFSKFWIFNDRPCHECWIASPCQISLKSFEPRPRYVSFNIMLVWLENAYSCPFWFFGGTFPQMMSLIVLTPKGPYFGWTTSFEP